MSSPDVHLTRVIPAPPERVFAAWLDPELCRIGLHMCAQRRNPEVSGASAVFGNAAAAAMSAPSTGKPSSARGAVG